MYIILFCDNLTLYVPFSNHTPPYYSVVHAKMNINKLGYVFEGVDETTSYILTWKNKLWSMTCGKVWKSWKAKILMKKSKLILLEKK